MVLKKFLFIFFGFTMLHINAQNSLLNKKLLSINNKPITVKEFIEVYKKNIDVIRDENERKIKNYINLYIDFKLKIIEAKRLKLDKTKSFISDYEKYKKQITEKYIIDSLTINNLVIEAYNRSKVEVSAEHILLKVLDNAQPKDTLLAYNKLLNIRSRIIKGESFKQLALQYSQDPSVRINKGSLGYFTVFDMTYPFESKAYNTKNGEVSLPFRTKFGYHIIKVLSKQPARGKVLVEHIMLKNKKKEDVEINKKKIEYIYNQLKKGANFEYLAIKNSQDESSSKQGGLLPKFGVGKMLKPFENVAFSLKREGDFSKPFLTPFGWHIVKLIKKYPIEDFTKSKDILKRKVFNSDRIDWAKRCFVKTLKEKYNVTVNKNSLNMFFAPNNFNKTKNSNYPLFVINKNKYYQQSFRKYLIENNINKNISLVIFNKFLDNQILTYYKDNITFKNNKIEPLLSEYKNGILIFNLMQQKVWNKAQQDNIGLKEYYNAHETKYKDKLQNIKVQVVEDYQNYLNKLLISDLKKNNKVIIDNAILEKTIKEYER